MQRRVGPIEQFMTEDHSRLNRILQAASADRATVDDVSFERFRRDLLRHIGMEEKVLLPFARSKRGGQPLLVATRLRMDHGQIAKLLTRSPTPASVAALRDILLGHNDLEEGPGGLYALCDDLAGSEAPAVVERLRAQPEVPLAKYYDGPLHQARGRT